MDSGRPWSLAKFGKRSELKLELSDHLWRFLVAVVGLATYLESLGRKRGRKMDCLELSPCRCRGVSDPPGILWAVKKREGDLLRGILLSLSWG